MREQKSIAALGYQVYLMTPELKWALFQKLVLYFVFLCSLTFPFLFAVEENNTHLTYNRTPQADDLPGKFP